MMKMMKMNMVILHQKYYNKINQTFDDPLDKIFSGFLLLDPLQIINTIR